MSDSVESPDTLQSRQTAQIKDIWGAGPILGPVSFVEGTGYQSFALDYTRVQNPDGTYNFPDIQDPDFPDDPTKRIPSTLTIDFRNGTQDQEPITGFEFEAATSGEGLRLRKDTPYVRQFTNPNLDAIRFDVRVPILRSINDGNKINGASVSLKFELRYDAGSYAEFINHTIRGKASTSFIQSFQLDLDPAERPWASITVRITRITPDSTSTNLQNETYIDSYTEIVDRKLSHPLHAYSGIQFDARQFSSIPVRAVELYGLICAIPMNYNPWTREYATTGPGTTGGIWDGTWKYDWTDNNAWVCWYLLTDPENGMGLDPDELGSSKFDFYAAAKHCDELIDDGFGGQEPRYTCNTVIGGREDAIKVLADFFGSMNAAPAYIGGQIVPIQDRYIPPEEWGDAFGPTNVDKTEGFVFSSTSKKQRHTVALVEWNDPNDFGRPKTEYVEDQAGINENGYNEIRITGIGITSRGQAHRKGRMMLLQEALRTSSVRFKTGLQGAAQRPGDVIPCSIPWRAGKVMTGRAKGGTVGLIDLDREVVIEAGKTYSIMFTDNEGENVEVDIGNAPGTYATLNFTEALANAPLPHTVWILSASDLVPELFSVFNVAILDQLKSEVTAIQYDPSIYAKVEGGLVLEHGPTSVVPDPSFCNPVENIVIEEFAGIDNASAFNHKLIVKWDRPVMADGSIDPFVSDYAVKVRYNSGDWRPYPATRTPMIDIAVEGNGFYEIEVVAQGALGRKSVPRLARYYVSPNNPLEGADIDHLEIVGQGNDVEFETADVQFGWRIISPAILASGADPTGLNSILDTFFRGYIIKMYAADQVTLIQDEVIVMQPTYTFNLERNKTAARFFIGPDALPYNEFTIGIRILDRYKNLSPERKLKVKKKLPRPPIEPANLVPTVGGVNAGWTNQLDVSRKQINLHMDVSPLLPPGNKVATASADSERKSIDGIAGTGVRSFWAESEDVFGLKSAPLFLGFVVPGKVNDIAEVTFDPDGGALPGPTPPNNLVYLTHPDPEAKIWYQINITNEAFEYSTVEAANNHLYDIVGEIGINDDGATITAAAFVRGLWGPPTTRAFTRNTGGGGNSTIAPTFDPPAGEHRYPTLDVSAASPSADYIFYKHANGAASDPTHDGATPPNATGGTIRVPGNVLVLTLGRGYHQISAMAYKAGMADSSVSRATYRVIKEIGGL